MLSTCSKQQCAIHRYHKEFAVRERPRVAGLGKPLLNHHSEIFPNDAVFDGDSNDFGSFHIVGSLHNGIIAAALRDVNHKMNQFLAPPGRPFGNIGSVEIDVTGRAERTQVRDLVGVASGGQRLDVVDLKPAGLVTGGAPVEVALQSPPPCVRSGDSFECEVCSAHSATTRPAQLTGQRSGGQHRRNGNVVPASGPSILGHPR